MVYDIQDYWDFGLCPSSGMFPKRCVLFFRIPDDGQSKNPVVLK
jgi:hypothetical protein